MPQNPAWTNDELILALDLYFREPRARNVKTHPALPELASTLRSLPIHGAAVEAPNFRNVNSCYLKLQNIKAVDPAYVESGRVGMKAGATPRLAELFGHFSAHRDELAEIAADLRESVESGAFPVIDGVGEDEHLEGRLVWRAHLARERSKSAPRARRAAMRRDLGQLVCEACGLTEHSATEIYGAFDREFFECHHKLPLAFALGPRKTKSKDLAVLCPDCHKAIHARGDDRSVEQLRELLNPNAD